MGGLREWVTIKFLPLWEWHMKSLLRGSAGSISMPGRTRKRQFDHHVFKVCRLTTLIPWLHFLLCPFILSASVYFWQIWQECTGLAEAGSLPTLLLLLQIASELSCRLLGLGKVSASVFVITIPGSALGAGCPAEPAGQPQGMPSEYSGGILIGGLDNKDETGAESGKGKYFICLTVFLLHGRWHVSSTVH